MEHLETEKQNAAKEAVLFLRNNMIVGLGTGSTARYAIEEIARLVATGLEIKAVPTSEQTKELATRLKISVIDINTIDHIDVTIDGADEFTEDLYLIKGGGGALTREKIVASITKEQIIIADSSKKVRNLGKFKLPVEVIPFAYHYVISTLSKLGGKAQLRAKRGIPFLTDQNNYIIDVDFGLIEKPEILSLQLNGIEGVVAHGLFLHLTTRVIMGEGKGTVSYVK